MAVRRVNTLGAITMALIYWGGLTYWRSDALFGKVTPQVYPWNDDSNSFNYSHQDNNYRNNILRCRRACKLNLSVNI